MDFYGVLGVGPEASAEEIKRAYRDAAFRLHPDTNPKASKAAHARFHELQEAYAVLRDEAKRRQYDAMRAAGFGAADAGEAAASGAGFATPWGQPSMDGKDFDRRFDEWWKRMSEEFRDYEDRQSAKERMSAERMAKAAAWEWEKEQAQHNKVRARKLKWATEDARMQRHATVLRRFWQTHAGFTPGDALFLGVLLAGAVGIALAWRSHIQEARQQQQQQQARHQQHLLPAMAAAAAAAASHPP